jgi:ubiquinone/menaquinone biosynthesis C-methylase UbiE
MGADHKPSSVFDECVARDYEAWYEQGFGSFAVRQEEALLHHQLQHFTGANSLLEVGCGTGHFTRWFAKQGLHVTGLDASPAMLEQARLRNGTNYLLGDAQALPFANQRFDLVALITTLEFVTDPVQALREALRVARQGLLLGVLNRSSLVESLRLLRGQRPGGVLAQAHRFSVKELTRRVRQAAGKRSVIITWHTTIFPGRLSLGAIWLPWGEYLGMSVHLEPRKRSKA